ncbi:MAG: DUF4956 domain-containing protein [Bacteroidales bacterium]|nr:DUF4956 domain-containing protein [Bacteroidales bacterium]
MTYIKRLLIIILFFGLYPGFTPVLAQVNQPTVNVTNQAVSADGSAVSVSKNEKDLNKDKDVVVINKRFFYGFGFDVLTMLLIFGLIYFPNYRNKEFMFTFFLFNIIIFIITFVLNKTNISMGAAFGLFAVFSMLRYRTEGISMKEMTYLLIAIALGLINAIGLNLVPILVFNSIFAVFIFVLDHPIVFKQEVSKTVLYENIDLIRPENQELLMADLRKRTGFDIHRFSIMSFDFLKDAASITIYYYKKK